MKIWKRDYYEKLLGTTGTVREYQLRIEEAQKKILELQLKCSHDNHEVVLYSWRPGAISPSHVCTECRKYLGSATEEESKKMWESYSYNLGNVKK